MNQADMTPEEWKRLEALFAAALELPREKRAKFLADQCRDEPEVQRRVENLLENHYRTADSWEKPVVKFPRVGFPLGGYLAEGTLLLDRFKIVRRVGSGGMGDVYEATDLELGRIALKTIRPDIAQNSAILARFKVEVMLARPIRGANVCHIYELYVPPRESGCPCSAFLTMEFLDGVTLAKRIATGDPMAPKEALKVATQLCAALQSIHEAGVVHRDLKPGNIMLVPRNGSEQVVVMDFGLARALAPKSPTDATGLTVAGGIMGTPAYMAPEQFEGGEVSPATDIYALGIVLYELVTGQQPFAALTPFGIAVRHARRPDPPSSIRKGVPHIWDTVISRCMEYDPARRYQSAREVIQALSHPPLASVTLPNNLRLSLTRAGLLTTSAVILAGLMAGGWMLYQAARIQTLSAEAQPFYDRGMMALRDGTYLQATKAFQKVLELDKRYALTHARLADAWAELDFTGQAQSEMLQAAAPEAQSTMPELGREYVDAVRQTLVRDYSAAAQDYEKILDKLPDEQKADGFVDLGRAYEKAGRIKETIASYEQAAKMRPDDPAPFVHLGILKSRQRDPAGAEAAFSKAEALYQAESNLEGQAEVAYQRGYAANEAADSTHAHEYLSRSLEIARQINSPQLEARSLLQLCSVEYHSNEDDKAIEDANHGIEIAREHELEYWSTDGAMRLGNAYLDKGDLAKAELYSQDALRLARENQHPRVEANAAFTLASVRDVQGGRWGEEIAFAQEALKYFKDYGFADAAAAASILIVRSEIGEGHLAQARKDSVELLRASEEASSKVSVEYAENLTGEISLVLEDHPDALSHYKHALSVSRALHDDEADQEIGCAAALWRLGRYSDAEAALKEISPDVRKRSDISISVADTLAPMRLSQGRYLEAINISTHALTDPSQLSVAQIADLTQVRALAESQLHQTEAAQLDIDQLVKLGNDKSDEGITAQAELAKADILLRENHPDKAAPLLEAANQYFSKTGMKESEWRSLFLLAKAANASGDKVNCSKTAAKALDILRNLEQSWGSASFALYSSRPDRRPEIRELTNIR